MPEVTINLFGKLQEEYLNRGLSPTGIIHTIRPGDTIIDLLKQLNIDENEVEGVFLNGRIAPLTSKLKGGDRIGLIPYGTPGPHRFLMGIYKSKSRKP